MTASQQSRPQPHNPSVTAGAGHSPIHPLAAVAGLLATVNAAAVTTAISLSVPPLAALAIPLFSIAVCAGIAGLAIIRGRS